MTMNEAVGNEAVGADDWTDPDDAPPLTREFFEAAHVYHGDTLVRRGRGRPPIPDAKRQVTLRLDPDVLDAFRATGAGWQTRINDVLRQALDARCLPTKPG